MLRGPAHPEQFRQQVGRYGDRFYVDNLPADEFTANRVNVSINPLPSISVVKQAFPKFLTDWAAATAARYAVEHSQAWMQLPDDDAVDLITKAAVRQRDRAAKRGSDVHKIIEDLSLGHRPDYNFIDDAVAPYVPCIEQLVKDLRLRPAVLEAVIFNHEVGYGGTFDFIGDTVHGVGLLDWKTRVKTSRYDEEAAQVAAYAGAEYMIVESPLGGAMRQELPQLDFMATVVISPEGYQVHEVNEEAGWKLWTSLHAFWVTKSTGGPFFEGTLATPHSLPAVDKQNLVDRVRALTVPARAYLASRWPDGLPTLKQNPTDYDLIRIDQLVTEVEAKDSAPFDPVAPPDEGEQLDIITWRHIDQTYRTLDWEIRQAVDFYLDTTPDIRMGNFMRSVRRFEILRMLIYSAELTRGDTGRMAELYNPVTLARITKEEACERANDYRERLEQGAILQ